MITFTVYRDPEGMYKGFRCEGHAGYADSGQDIICAAVSILVITIGNSLEVNSDVKLTGRQNSGFAEVLFESAPDDKADLLMDTLLMGMNGIIGSSPKGYIRIREQIV